MPFWTEQRKGYDRDRQIWSARCERLHVASTGGYHLLQKPISPMTLRTTLTRLLKRAVDAREERTLAHPDAGGGGNDRFRAVRHLQRLDDGGDVNLHHQSAVEF
jgi:hypothetical protein